MRIETHRLPALWLAIVATLVITLALSACSNAETEVPDPAATPTVSPAATAPLEPEPTHSAPESTAAATATPSPEPTATATPEPARPTSVTVGSATVDLTALGATAQLMAEVRDQDSTVMTGVTVTWTTSASSVATVDAAGVVTAAGNGTVTITAAAGPASGSAVVTVTQEVASVEVSPSMTELTAWGETIHLTAQALDANGHAVAEAEFSWESADVLVAEVDALGLVSGLGEGEATITASAGAASGSAVVAVPPTFTLSGTVRDSRENGPALAGAVVRLENGKLESMVIGPDGGYRFANVWGTVTVRVIAWPTHVTETIEITVEKDRTLDFNLEHTGAPPNTRATTNTFLQVIEHSDPTRLASITYAGRGERGVSVEVSETWITINAYLFDVRYGGQVVEFRVNPEFGSREAAQAEVETFAHALGQMPAVLMPGIKHVVIHDGEGRWHASLALGYIVIYPKMYPDGNEETFVHEATHATLDLAHKDSPGWRAAQEADGVFISNYARDNPDSEDVAESFLAWFAVRYQSERLTIAEIISILRTIPIRLIYFDEQGFDMSPYTPSEVQYPSEEIVTIQGKVIGPNSQPLEGLFLWAWAGSEDNSVTATTGEDGSFGMVVPDGSFTMFVYATEETCTLMGWHGPGGFTTVEEEATLITVEGQSVLDIVIRLPDHPEALILFEEWCA